MRETKEPKDDRLSLRLPSKTKKEMHRRAALENRGISDYVINCHDTNVRKKRWSKGGSR